METHSDIENKNDFEKYNRIIVFSEERTLSEPCFSVLENQGRVYFAKNIQDGILHLTLFIYHLICILIKSDDWIEISCRLVNAIRKVSEVPVLVLIPEMPKLKYELIYTGADVVLKTGCSAEDFGLHVYALIRAYKRWRAEKKEVTNIKIGDLIINVLQRKVYWREKEIKGG